MNKELVRLISESRQYISAASPQQKLRFLQLIKKSMARLNEDKSKTQVDLPKNLDYIEEK